MFRTVKSEGRSRKGLWVRVGCAWEERYSMQSALPKQVGK